MLGIDLGKNSCSLVGLDATGKVVVQRRMRRETVIAFCSKLSGCTVAMEACCGARNMGRALAAQGHVIRLMSPECWNGRPRFPRAPTDWSQRSAAIAMMEAGYANSGDRAGLTPRPTCSPT
jgi:transposase